MRETQCSYLSLLKSGPVDEPGNFWPISVVPVFAKLLEKIEVFQLTIGSNCV